MPRNLKKWEPLTNCSFLLGFLWFFLSKNGNFFCSNPASISGKKLSSKLSWGIAKRVLFYNCSRCDEWHLVISGFGNRQVAHFSPSSKGLKQTTRCVFHSSLQHLLWRNGNKKVADNRLKFERHVFDARDCWIAHMKAQNFSNQLRFVVAFLVFTNYILLKYSFILPDVTKGICEYFLRRILRFEIWLLHFEP